MEISTADHPVQLRNVSCAWGTKRVFDGLNLTLHASSVVGVVGPNGSGKSTLVRLILGLVRPVDGSVSVFGRRPDGGWMGASPVIASLLHARGVPPTHTPADAVTIAARLRGATLQEARGLADDALRAFGMLDVANDPMSSLSRGMQQRVALARTFVGQPSLLILDEGLDGLDVHSKWSTSEAIRSVRARGGAVLLVSHDLDLVDALCDRVLRLPDGAVRTLGDGQPSHQRSGLIRITVAEHDAATAIGAFPHGLRDRVTADAQRGLVRLSAPTSGTSDATALLQMLVRAGVAVEAVEIAAGAGEEST